MLMYFHSIGYLRLMSLCPNVLTLCLGSGKVRECEVFISVISDDPVNGSVWVNWQLMID